MRVPFAFDIFERERAAGEAEQQTFRSAGELAAVIHEAGDGFRIGGRRAVAQVQMDADAEARSGQRQLHSGFKGRAIGQERGAGDDAVAMRFGDATVNALGPAEVVCIYD